MTGRALRAIRGEILTCMDGYKEHYQRAYRCLDAAAEIQTDVRAMLAPPPGGEAGRPGHGILSRELKPKRSAPSGRVKQRFLDACLPQGAHHPVPDGLRPVHPDL